MSVEWNQDVLKSLDNLSQPHEVLLADLFDMTFMKKYTVFSSIDEFTKTSQLDFSNFESLDQSALDSFVAAHTSFNSWNDMQLKAIAIHFQNRLQP